MKALSVLAASALLVGATVNAHASPAISSFVFTIQQDGSNVDVTGSGNINLDGQTQDCTPPCTPLPSFMWSSAPGITTGATGAGVLVNEYAFSHSPTGPSNFGTGSLTNATTASGDYVGANFIPGGLIVPAGYISGNPLSDSATYDGATLASLGLTPGTYTWTWLDSSGLNTAGSFEIDVLAPTTPLPAALPLFATGIGGLGLLGWRRKRKARAVG